MPPPATSIGGVAARTARSVRHRRLASRVALGVVALGVTMVGIVGSAPSATAHPLGTPQAVRLSADERQVWLRWTAATDDLTALGIHLGVLGPDRRFVDDHGVLVPEQSDDYDTIVLAQTAALSRYLLEHIQVQQSGASCQGRVTDTAELAGDGARLRFTCPERVRDVTVRVDTLTDVDPAYRTLATSEGGERATYTLENPEHHWQLDRRTGLGGYPMGFWVTGVGLVLVVVPAASYLLLRRMRADNGPAR
jgi:hypothetical protein